MVQTVRVSNLERDKKFSFSPKHPHQLCYPYSFTLNRYGGRLRVGKSGQGLTLTSNHLVRRFKWVKLCAFSPYMLSNSNKLRGLRSRANYTDRAAAAGRRKILIKQCYLSPSYLSVISHYLLHPNPFGHQSCFSSLLPPDSAYLGNKMLKDSFT
jgi:hypothetical protein